MPKLKYKIMTAMFDIKPIDDGGDIDVDKISNIQTVLNLGRKFRIKKSGKMVLKNQKPAEAGIGESRLELLKTILDSDLSIANPLLMSREGVDSFSFPGPEGNRTPETNLSRIVSFQTGPRVAPVYQKKLNPQDELEKYLNEDLDPKIELASMGARIHKPSVKEKNSKNIDYKTILSEIKKPIHSEEVFIGEPKKMDIVDWWQHEARIKNYESRITSYETRKFKLPNLKIPKITLPKISLPRISSKKLIVGGLALILLGLLTEYGFSMKNEIVHDGNSAVANLENAGESIKNMDFVSASNNFAQAYQEFSKAGDNMNFMGANIGSLLSGLPGAGKLKSAKNLVEAGKLMANAGQAMSDAMSEISKTNLILNPLATAGSSVSIGEISASLKKALTLSQKNLKNSKALLADIDSSSIPEDKRASFEEFNSKLPLFEKLIDDFVGYSKFLGDFIGANGVKRYLILFQNPSELRPTGGFPGTYGVVSFKDGKLLDLKIDDVYNLDGQLQELIIPPVQLQHITPNWGMRDANWFVDFPTSARKITTFFKKEAGYDIDGVITFSPKIVTHILDIVGSVEMPEYNLTLDSENLLPTLQEEVEYKGNRNQPKKIIMDLAPKMLEKIYSAESEKWLEVFNLLVSSMEQKDLLMYFRDLNLQSFSVDKGFSGKIVNTDSDYLMVTFSNVKGSKTDSVIDSSLKLWTESENGKHKVSITRTHNGGDSKYGFYNKQSPTYVRVLVPEHSEFVGLTGNSRPDFKPLIDYANSGFKKDEDLAKFEEESYTEKETGVTIYKEAGKTEFGFWMIINPGETKTVDLEYKIPSSGESYQFYVQKQPGLDIDDFKFYMNDKLYFDGRLNKDMVIIPI